MTSLAPARPVDAAGKGALAGAYLLLDVVGFSGLCADLTRSAGRRAADRVSQFVRGTLGPLLEVIEREGGRAFDMAGDSIHALWVPRDGETPVEALARAERAVPLLFARLAQGGAGHAVQARIGIGFGAVAVSAAGPGRGPIVGGEALGHALRALARAKPGVVAIEGIGAAGGAWCQQAALAALPPLGLSADVGQRTREGETRTAIVMSLGLFPPGDAVVRDPDSMIPLLDTVRAALLPLVDMVEAAHLDEKGLTLKAVFGLDQPGAAAVAEAEARVRAAAPGLTLPIGIATGRLFAGPVSGSGARMMFGAPLILSTRLMEASQAGTILDAATCNVLRDRGRLLRPAGTLLLKGSTEPIDVFSLEGPSQAGPTAGATGGLLGRDAAVRMLGALLDEPVGRRVAVVEGGPGMGKSAVLQWAASEALRRGRQTVSLHPAPSAPAATARQWANAFGIDPAAMTEVQTAGETVLRAVSARPTVLCIDDGHWLDEVSRQLVRRAMRSSETLVLIVGVDQADAPGVAPWLRSLMADPADRIVLQPLCSEDTRGLLASRLGLDVLDEAELGAFEAVCGGAPGAIVELGEHWRGTLLSAALRSSERALRGDLDEIDLPLTLSQAIEHRVARLDAVERSILKAASAIGLRFDADIIAALELAPPPSVEAALRHAVREGLIVAEDGAAMGSFAFRTHGVWNVVYGMMAEEAAAETHRRLARAVSRRMRTGPERDAMLAFHLTRSGALRAATRYLERVGAHALRIGAPGAALKALQRALDAATDGGRPPMGRTRRARLRENAARAALALGDLERGLDHCRLGLSELQDRSTGWPALALARALLRLLASRSTTLSRHRDRDALAAGRLQALTTDAKYFAGDIRGMLLAAALAADSLDRGGAPQDAARPTGTLAYAAMLAGLEPVARWLLDRQLTVCDAAADCEGRAWVLGTKSLVDFAAGDTGAALESARSALAEAEAAGDPYLVALQCTVLGLVLHQRGAFAEAVEVFDRLTQVSRLRGADQHLAWGLYAAASARLWLGQTEGAERALGEARRLLDLVADTHSLLNLDSIDAMLALEQGDARAALARAQAAARRARTAPTSNFGSFEGFFGCAEVLLVLALQAGPAERPDRVREARDAVRAAARFARIFRCARPRLQQHEGVLALLEGSRRRAARAFARAADTAARTGLPWEAERAARLEALCGPGAVSGPPPCTLVGAAAEFIRQGEPT